LRAQARQKSSVDAGSLPHDLLSVVAILANVNVRSLPSGMARAVEQENCGRDVKAEACMNSAAFASAESRLALIPYPVK
jgi:hypothetical protein